MACPGEVPSAAILVPGFVLPVARENYAGAGFVPRGARDEAWASRESNPDPLRDRILSPARLPVPPLARNHGSINVFSLILLPIHHFFASAENPLEVHKGHLRGTKKSTNSLQIQQNENILLRGHGKA